MTATANWRCADCDYVNGTADKTCEICGGTRRAPAPAKARNKTPRPKAERPSRAKPTSDWRCAKCDTNNAAADASCLGCDTGWKVATKSASSAKKSPPKSAKPSSGVSTKPAPKKPTPKKTAPSSSSSARKSASKGTAPMRPPSTGSTRPTSGPRPESLFHPPPAAPTGYTPTVPRPAPSPPPAPAPAPAPAPMPRWTPPSAPTQKVNGCAVWLTILVVGFGLLVAGLSAIDIDSLAPQPADTSPSAAAPCPTRIAEELPSGNDSKLVEAFLTEEHRITLCLTTTGRLYYFGEWRDDRGSGIAMPARRTDDGYEARNPPYRYDIHDGVVTIYKADTRIGQETLTDNPSPK